MAWFILMVLPGLPAVAQINWDQGAGESIELPATQERALPSSESLPLGPPPAGHDEDAAGPSGFSLELGEFLRVGAALAGVVALLFVLRMLLRRMGGLPDSRRPSGVVQIHGRYPVARGQQVVLLQVGRRLLVTHQSGGGMRTLSEITEPDEVAQVLGRLEGGRSKRGHVPAGGDFQQELAQAAESKEQVVDLTRSPRPRRSRWRSDLPRRAEP